jgi:hypothetical protein
LYSLVLAFFFPDKLIFPEVFIVVSGLYLFIFLFILFQCLRKTNLISVIKNE